MYTLKSIAKRGASLAAAFVMVVSSLAASAAPAFADALNPLTERSLTLSSSSPGWADTDGSGNSTYAPPNSGANGKKTGNYFSFKVSTNTSSGSDKIKAMSFQYCTYSAGDCTSPGDGTDDATHANLNVNYPSAAEVDGADFDTVVDSTTGNIKAVPGYTNENPKYQANGGTGDPAEAAKNVAGNFIVMYYNGSAWVQSEDWTATTSNQEEASSGTTGKQNTIILQNTGAGMGLQSGTPVKVLFFATADNYITNPGSGAFFVKINTFKNFDALAGPTPGPENTLRDNINSGDVIDGGVTVANVMNQSIQITTKVLETMEFSVGTVDPDTLSNAQLGKAEGGSAASPVSHIPCDPIMTSMVKNDPAHPVNVLQLGNQSSESSLSSAATYATHSYWRLSSNSSAGATVYYSGHTLSNTSGDEVAPIGTTATSSKTGSEQFGLALATKADADTYNVDYSTAPNNTLTGENGADNDASGLVALNATTPSGNGIDASTLTDVGANASYHQSRLDPLVPTGKDMSDPTTPGLNYYGGGAGTIVNNGTAKFAFDPMSDTVPAPLASESSQVVDCVTAKMRYIANIAATTPAGIYTTKVNYIAAPQY